MKNVPGKQTGVPRAPADGLAAGGFELLASTRIAALATDVQRFRHRASGALHVHLAREERHHGFVLGFRAPPPDDSGVVHVLEHLTLCGSRRFPLRDAFFRVLHGSLATSMNARTSPDAISYHFATPSEPDFEQLLALFVDAAFFPLLEPLDFAREGHRLEFEQAGDARSPLRRAGVVWNEMRGAMASPRLRQRQALLAALFPDSCYRFNPGGDPEAIAGLCHEDLLAYHARHFRPANAVFMTAGPCPAARHQARFETLLLSCCEPGEPAAPPAPTPFAAPRSSRLACPGDSGEGATLLVGWLLGNSDDAGERLRDGLLEQLLLGDGDAPLRAFLEACNEARAPAPLAGLDHEPGRTVLACGLQGVDETAAPRLQRDILDVLAGVARSGVGPGRLRAALDRLALRQRDIDSGRQPPGLAMSLRVLPAVLRGADPAALLDTEAALRALEDDALEPAWLCEQVRARLLDNPHRAAVTLVPDPTLAEQRRGAEARTLAATARGLSESQRAHLLAQAERIAAADERRAATGTPTALHPRHVDPVAPFAVGRRGHAGGLPATVYRQAGRGVAGLLVALQPRLPGHEVAGDLGLLLAVLPELGCGGLDARATQARQAATGAGFAGSVLVRAEVSGASARLTATLTASALEEKRAALAALLASMLDSPRLDQPEHLRAVLRRLLARRQSELTGAGHRLAMGAAADGAGLAATLQESVTGLRALDRLRVLAEAPAEVLFTRLRAAHARLSAASVEIAVVCATDTVEADDAAFRDALAPLAGAHGRGGAAEQEMPASPLTPGGGAREVVVRAVDSAVGYLARAWPAPPAAHADAAALAVLGPLVADGFLHDALRGRGGAYGAGATYDDYGATFRMFSYRDPRIAGTLADFDRVPGWVDSASRDARAVQRAVLRAVAASEPPAAPVAMATRCFLDTLHGRGPRFAQRWRQALLGVDGAALRRVAARWLQQALARDAVLASPRALAEAGLSDAGGENASHVRGA